MRYLPLILLAALPTIGLAQTAPPAAPAASSAIPAPDPAWKVPEVIAFIGVKPGDRVADVIGGRLTASLARAVGPTGKVYAIETAEIAKTHPDGVTKMRALAAAMPNIVVSADPIASPLPAKLDAVFIRQNYHDLYDKFMGPADVPAFNRAVYAALKPGGVFVVLDHEATPGSGIGATETLHRIDKDRVKADMKAAGFRFDGESAILANPADDHSKGVFDPSVRGHTDQFLLRFRKPR
ncbi:MAG: class I SAM-dependent methyltransferase [Sphingomonas sp.]|uniref:class I SAM-dependent methyltransferase n=1 Tax=Sphingomonas sp. TaxID=28214 RepID=UPI001AD5CF6B|nr:methyltransferase [Sphingomonas sp.]MBN8809555.1 class I SAM-dependent methyltransferase [Sphingomonas sp.]